MMYSAYKLNKQGDNIQPWCTPFPIWNQSIVPCPVLTVASWPAYSHLFQNFPQFIVIHTVKGFSIVNKAEIDIFLELSCFFDDPADVGNLISGSSAFSKTSLNIRKFTAYVLLKPGLENFELSRLVITFLPRSKHLLISWLQSSPAVILEPPKIKSDTVSTVSPSISHEVMGPDAMIFVFWMLSFKPTFSLSHIHTYKLTDTHMERHTLW